jgi:multidrug efflux pump subunit AcrB
MQGGLLAMVVLLFFLRRLRLTLIIADRSRCRSSWRCR